MLRRANLLLLPGTGSSGQRELTGLLPCGRPAARAHVVTACGLVTACPHSCRLAPEAVPGSRTVLRLDGGSCSYVHQTTRITAPSARNWLTVFGQLAQQAGNLAVPAGRRVLVAHGSLRCAVA